MKFILKNKFKISLISSVIFFLINAIREKHFGGAYITSLSIYIFSFLAIEFITSLSCYFKENSRSNINYIKKYKSEQKEFGKQLLLITLAILFIMYMAVNNRYADQTLIFLKLNVALLSIKILTPVIMLKKGLIVNGVYIEKKNLKFSGETKYIYSNSHKSTIVFKSYTKKDNNLLEKYLEAI